MRAIEKIMSPPTLAERVAAEIERKVVRRLSPGDRLPALRTMAGQLGVSVNTLQSALTMLRQRGLVESRQGSGVYVAERRTPLRVGLLSELDLLDPRIGPHFRTATNLLRRTLGDRGVEVQLYVGQAEPGLGVSDEPTCPKFWQDAAAGNLDGAVILDVPSTEAWHRRVRQLAIPAVGSMTKCESGSDIAGMTAAAVQHLAGQGCRNLGLLSWHGEDFFRQAVAAAGLNTHDTWIRADIDPSIGGTGWEEFREIWSATAGRPDGLLILDDMLFADAQLAMLELNVRIPQHLRLVSLSVRDASPAPRLPVARLEINPEKEAQFLVDRLMAQLRGEMVEPVKHTNAFQLIAETGECVLCEAPKETALAR